VWFDARRHTAEPCIPIESAASGEPLPREQERGGLTLTPVKYRVGPPTESHWDEVFIEERTGRGGILRWAVTRNSDVLNRSGEWEWEPNPSSRTDAFLRRTRYATVDAALDAARRVLGDAGEEQ
jgi:hypothetical protein